MSETAHFSEPFRFGNLDVGSTVLSTTCAADTVQVPSLAVKNNFVKSQHRRREGKKKTIIFYLQRSLSIRRLAAPRGLVFKFNALKCGYRNVIKKFNGGGEDIKLVSLVLTVEY